MKKFLFLLISIVGLSACQSARVLPAQSPISKVSPASSYFADESASLDTFSAPINAAQTSSLETVPVYRQPDPGRNMVSPKPRIFRSLRLARKMASVYEATDSTDLYVRRKLPDTRPVNRTAKASLLLGIGTYAFLILSGLGIPIIGLLSFLAAIGAIVTGIVALSELRKYKDQYRGKGQAIAGLVLGSTFLFLILLLILVLIIAIASWQ